MYNYLNHKRTTKTEYENVTVGTGINWSHMRKMDIFPEYKENHFMNREIRKSTINTVRDELVRLILKCGELAI